MERLNMQRKKKWALELNFEIFYFSRCLMTNCGWWCEVEWGAWSAAGNLGANRAEGSHRQRQLNTDLLVNHIQKCSSYRTENSLRRSHRPADSCFVGQQSAADSSTITHVSEGGHYSLRATCRLSADTKHYHRTGNVNSSNDSTP
jgi:hypothetical protein